MELQHDKEIITVGSLRELQHGDVVIGPGLTGGIKVERERRPKIVLESAIIKGDQIYKIELSVPERTTVRMGSTALIRVAMSTPGIGYIETEDGKSIRVKGERQGVVIVDASELLEGVTMIVNQARSRFR